MKYNQTKNKINKEFNTSESNKEDLSKIKDKDYTLNKADNFIEGDNLIESNWNSFATEESSYIFGSFSPSDFSYQAPNSNYGNTILNVEDNSVRTEALFQTETPHLYLPIKVKYLLRENLDITNESLLKSLKSIVLTKNDIDEKCISAPIKLERPSWSDYWCIYLNGVLIFQGTPNQNGVYLPTDSWRGSYYKAVQYAGHDTSRIEFFWDTAKTMKIIWATQDYLELPSSNLGTITVTRNVPDMEYFFTEYTFLSGSLGLLSSGIKSIDSYFVQQRDDFDEVIKHTILKEDFFYKLAKTESISYNKFTFTVNHPWNPLPVGYGHTYSPADVPDNFYITCNTITKKLYQPIMTQTKNKTIVIANNFKIKQEKKNELR